jgi:hypothetical protein
VLQSIPYAAEEVGDPDPESVAFLQDMDFDGSPDVGVLFSPGLQNVFYNCWLWREDAGAFVQYDGFSEISNPGFDAERRRVTSFTHGSATDNVSAEYAWENGELVLITETTQEFSEEDEEFVIRRSVRGDDGEMRQMQEKTLSEEEMHAYLENGGLNMALVTSMSQTRFQVASMILDNGEWWVRDTLEGISGLDGVQAVLESRRLPAAPFVGESVERMILKGWPSAREISVTPFTELSEKLTYPVLQAEFVSGEGEETRQHAAAMVFADDWSFWFVLKGPFADDASRETLKGQFAEFLLDINEPDPEDDEFPDTRNFDAAPPLSVFNADAEALPGLSVMDALLRIQEIVDPGDFRWIDEGVAFAYSYDGVGEVAGVPSLRLSFGDNTPEKYTAMRHFAVDTDGAVYEMDTALGPDAFWL